MTASPAITAFQGHPALQAAVVRVEMEDRWIQQDFVRVFQDLLGFLDLKVPMDSQVSQVFLVKKEHLV